MLSANAVGTMPTRISTIRPCLLAIVRAVRKAHAVQSAQQSADPHGGGSLPVGAWYSAGLRISVLAAAAAGRDYEAISGENTSALTVSATFAS